jgi:RHS repeat-associated protein
VKRVEIQNAIGRTTIMIWGHEPSEGWGLLEERGPNGELLARHVHGPSIDDLVLSELSGAVYFYHQDHLNSTTAVTDESGNVVEQYRYDVYGQPFFYGPDGARRGESALGIRFLFTGREWLASLGPYDYRHRAYSPSLGRFLQLDPLGFAAGNVNVYGCCANNPINSIDPLGLCSDKSDRSIGFWDWVQGVLDAAGIVEPTPFCDVGNAIISMFRGRWTDAGWPLLAAVPYVGDLGKAGKYGSKAVKYSDDAAALIDLAKQAKRTGVSPADAETLLKWADEVNLLRRGPEVHPKRNIDFEHIHIGPVDHIPVKR